MTLEELEKDVCSVLGTNAEVDHVLFEVLKHIEDMKLVRSGELVFS